MILERLSLRNFRSYGKLDLEFGPGVNLIVGENGSGKTNLAEAIYFLSLARSWRTSEDASLISFGESSAYIAADVSGAAGKRKLEFEIAPRAKKIRMDGKTVGKLSELSKATNVIVFSPEDVGMFGSSPSLRRNFLDVAISKTSPEYMLRLGRYNALLKERNASLKQPMPDRSLIEAYSSQMGPLAAFIVNSRLEYVRSLNAVVGMLYSRLGGREAECLISYRPFAPVEKEGLEAIRKAYAESLESDLAHGSTGVGPHREDFRFLLSGKDVSAFGSQGENRLASLALKLSPYLLFGDDGEKPICVLDDVTSELDPERIANLVQTIKGFSQTFITATNLDIPGASVFEVSNHAAIRR